MKIDTMNKNYQTKYDQNKQRKKIWENYVGLIQVELKHTYPELYTVRAVLVKDMNRNDQFNRVCLTD